MPLASMRRQVAVATGISAAFESGSDLSPQASARVTRYASDRGGHPLSGDADGGRGQPSGSTSRRSRGCTTSRATTCPQATASAIASISPHAETCTVRDVLGLLQDDRAAFAQIETNWRSTPVPPPWPRSPHGERCFQARHEVLRPPLRARALSGGHRDGGSCRRRGSAGGRASSGSAPSAPRAGCNGAFEEGRQNVIHAPRAISARATFGSSARAM